MKARTGFLLILLSLYAFLLYFRPFIEKWTYAEYSGTTLGLFLVVSFILTDQSFIFFKTLIFTTGIVIAISGIPLMFNPDISLNSNFYTAIYKTLVAFSLFFIVKWIFQFGGNQTIVFVKFLIIIAAINTFLGFLLFNYGIQFQTSTNVIGLDAASGRIAGMRGENYTGYWSAPLFSGILFLAFKKSTSLLYRLFFMFVALIGIISIILGLSRTGIISIILIFLFTQYNSYHRSNNKLSRFILLAIFSVATFIIADMFIDNLINTILDQKIITEQTLRLQSDNRSYIWISWLNTALDNPAGIGPGAILEQLNSHYGVVPHNSFLDVFVEYGFVGLFIMIILLISVFRNFNLKSDDFTLVTLMGAFLGMLTSLFFLSNPLLPLHFIIAGGIVGRNKWLNQHAEKK